MIPLIFPKHFVKPKLWNEMERVTWKAHVQLPKFLFFSLKSTTGLLQICFCDDLRPSRMPIPTSYHPEFPVRCRHHLLVRLHQHARACDDLRRRRDDCGRGRSPLHVISVFAPPRRAPGQKGTAYHIIRRHSNSPLFARSVGLAPASLWKDGVRGNERVFFSERQQVVR